MVKKVAEADTSVPLTEAVEAPGHPHAEYEYEHGEMRRCHLCGEVDDHLGHRAEQVWFSSLRARAHHILECHRDKPIEVQRAREILDIADLWDSKAEAKPVTFKLPIVGEVKNPLRNVAGQETVQQVAPSKPVQKGFFRTHPIWALILLGLIGYGLYCIYLIMFHGYTF